MSPETNENFSATSILEILNRSRPTIFVLVVDSVPISGPIWIIGDASPLEYNT